MPYRVQTLKGRNDYEFDPDARTFPTYQEAERHAAEWWKHHLGAQAATRRTEFNKSGNVQHESWIGPPRADFFQPAYITINRVRG